MRRRPSPSVLVLVAGSLAGALLSACAGPDSEPGGADATAGALPAGDHVHALRVTDDGALLLGLHGALWRSPDGVTWEQLGLEGQDAMALGVAEEGEPLLVGGHDVLVRSTDGGQTFDDLRPDDLPSRDIHALAQAPGEPSLVYAFVVGAGVFRSTDAGESWEPAAPAGEEIPADVGAMAVDPTDPRVVLLGSGSQGVFRSDDGARTFRPTSEWGTIGLAFADDGTVAAATYRGVDLSSDGGERWRNVAPVEDLEGQPVAVAIGGDGAVWVVTEDPRTLLRSTAGDGDFEEVARA
ncbi:MAG: hypothetical protein KY461_01570 [Actinobacteria bacterium]|nr:hypothetical protein [Actinomycetota bacterium]